MFLQKNWKIYKQKLKFFNFLKVDRWKKEKLKNVFSSISQREIFESKNETVKGGKISCELL